MTEKPSEFTPLSRKLAANAKAHLVQLQDAVADAKRVASAWQRLNDYVSDSWMVHVNVLLRSEREALLAHPNLSEADRESLDDLADCARSHADQLMRRYPSVVERSCKDRGIPLDQDSRHPKYSFRNKALTLDVDEKKQLARVATNEGLLKRLPADVDAVLAVIECELQRLFERPFNSTRFIKSLRKHYLAICKAQKVSDGDAVPIRAITRRLSKNQKAFRIDEFVVDLSRLVEGDIPVVDERRLDLQQTKDTKQGILLQGKAARGYVGFVLFRKAQPG